MGITKKETKPIEYKELILEEIEDNPELAAQIVLMLVKWFPVYDMESVTGQKEYGLKSFVEFYQKEGFFKKESFCVECGNPCKELFKWDSERSVCDDCLKKYARKREEEHEFTTGSQDWEVIDLKEVERYNQEVENSR